MKSERKYSISIVGQVFSFTLFELKWILTREAYDLYFHTYRQGGKITFGEGSLCTIEFLELLDTIKQ
jgi:hypothetical protein